LPGKQAENAVLCRYTFPGNSSHPNRQNLTGQAFGPIF
jgi:hypothetical protein